MKRKIAVLANGWNHLGIASALKGIRSVTDKLNIDVFLFLSFAAFAQSQERNDGEDAVFDLPPGFNPCPLGGESLGEAGDENDIEEIFE